MDELRDNAAAEIEQIHSSWIKFEIAGEDHRLMSLCADDIQLWPPDAQPLVGREAVSPRLSHGTTRIRGIEIADCRIRGYSDSIGLVASPVRCRENRFRVDRSRNQLQSFCTVSKGLVAAWSK
jgi:hypothetical protein